MIFYKFFSGSSHKKTIKIYVNFFNFSYRISKILMNRNHGHKSPFSPTISRSTGSGSGILTVIIARIFVVSKNVFERHVYLKLQTSYIISKENALLNYKTPKTNYKHDNYQILIVFMILMLLLINYQL